MDLIFHMQEVDNVDDLPTIKKFYQLITNHFGKQLKLKKSVRMMIQDRLRPLVKDFGLFCERESKAVSSLKLNRV